ncbi:MULTISPECIES: ABC transporter permease [unclassified Pseudoclavibacter]|uniref:ABC transporter permease n=1 Tax=unclassified Pseudoclavibacter TaxID=2615177 RepID=UPI001BA65160|nr:iron ABC transporter permease [Pseudoclavibacter sp. Marseille-Q4354]MBS3180584.1 iron ABC transporter permease [Pseudoclavibacter sp. Marseille-Q4354]
MTTSIIIPETPEGEPPVPPRARRGKRPPKTKTPLAYRLRVLSTNPTTTIGILALLLFTYLIVAPIISLLGDGITVDRADTAITQQEEGSFTSYYLWRVLFSPQAAAIFWGPLGNTVVIAVCSVALALVIGVCAAWLLVRTNMWGRKWFATALIVPYMLPAWTFALAWLTMFKNRSAGGQAGWLEAMGVVVPDWLAYGRVPIILIFAIHFVPFVILLVGNALKRFDSTLEESAQILGSSRIRTAFTIVLPILRPSLISAVTLILAKVLGEFGVAYVLGLPVNMNVLATSLYRSVYNNQQGSAAVIVAAIVLIGAISLWVDMHFLKEAKRFVTISGKSGSAGNEVRLGRSRIFATLACVALFTVSVALPILVLALSTVMRVPGSFAPDNFTLDFWIGTNLQTFGFPNGILLNAEVLSAAFNTFWIVGLSSVMAGVVGLLVGYVIVRSESRLLSGTLRQMLFFPYLVPGIAFATAYLSLFAVQRGPVPALYGTAALLVIIYFTEQMPFASRAGISAMMQLGSETEEAARVAGAGWFHRFRTIILPVQKSAVATSMLMSFISGVKSLSLVVILAVPGLEVLTTLSIRLLDVGYTQAGNGVVLVVSALAFFGTYAVQKIMKTDLSRGLGG